MNWPELPSFEPAVPNKPDLLFVVCDTMRADYSSVYGGPVAMPTFERLAEESAVFERAYAVAPWTLPSMYGLFTSQFPPSLTAELDDETRRKQGATYVSLGKDQPTLAPRLKAEGYATSALVGNYLMSRTLGLLDGFDTQVVLAFARREHRGPFRQFKFFQGVLKDWLPMLAPLRPIDTTRPLTLMAKSFLRHHRGEPVALYLHYMDPHDPYDPPRRYRSREDGPWPLFAPVNNYFGTPQMQAKARTLDLPIAERHFVRTLYAAEMRYVDDALGQVLRRFDARERPSVVCVTADHGEELWDHGKIQHGHTLFEELLHVPWMIRAPGVEPGRHPEPVSAIHLTPTLAALLAMDAPEAWRGRSLVPWLVGETNAPDAPVFAQGTLYAPTPLRAVVEGYDKLIETIDGKQRDFYDLADDPGEHHPGRRGGKAIQPYVEMLEVWSKSFPSSLGDFWKYTDELTEADTEALEAMGYL